MDHTNYESKDPNKEKKITIWYVDKKLINIKLNIKEKNSIKIWIKKLPSVINFKNILILIKIDHIIRSD